MRARLAKLATPCLVLLVVLSLAAGAMAQDKAPKGDKAAKAPPMKMSNVQGKVGRVDKDTIVVMIGNNPKPVVFGADTKFLFGHSNDNKPGKIADVKQGYFIACSGSANDKGQFMAKECVYRDKQ